jgi:hypothetical protein
VKLVHHHVLHIRVRALAQRDVRENLRGAAEDGRVAIHRRVTRAEANIVGTELAAEGEPLLVHQRLDRAGVNGTPPLRDGLEVQRGGHERFARAGGRVENDILLLEQLQDGRLLRRIQRELAPLDIFEEAPQQHIVVGAVTLWNQIVKRRHRSRTLPARGAAEKAHQTEVTLGLRASRRIGWLREQSHDHQNQNDHHQRQHANEDPRRGGPG